MFRKCFIFISLLSFISCAGPTILKLQEMPDIKFDKTPPYSIDLSKIPKPDKLNRLYGIKRNDGGITLIKEEEKDKSDYIILTPSEYNKIGILTDIGVGYKGIIEQQVILINNQIDIVNSLKEYVELERIKSKEYASMFVDAKNQYYLEQYNNKKQMTFEKIKDGILQTVLLATILGLSL